MFPSPSHTLEINKIPNGFTSHKFAPFAPPPKMMLVLPLLSRGVMPCLISKWCIVERENKQNVPSTITHIWDLQKTLMGLSHINFLTTINRPFNSSSTDLLPSPQNTNKQTHKQSNNPWQASMNLHWCAKTLNYKLTKLIMVTESTDTENLFKFYFNKKCLTDADTRPWLDTDTIIKTPSQLAQFQSIF